MGFGANSCFSLCPENGHFPQKELFLLWCPGMRKHGAEPSTSCRVHGREAEINIDPCPLPLMVSAGATSQAGWGRHLVCSHTPRAPKRPKVHLRILRSLQADVYISGCSSSLPICAQSASTWPRLYFKVFAETKHESLLTPGPPGTNTTLSSIALFSNKTPEWSHPAQPLLRSEIYNLIKVNVTAWHFSSQKSPGAFCFAKG